MSLILYFISLAGAVTIFKWSWDITDIIMDVLTGESLTNSIKRIIKELRIKGE